MGLLVDGKWHDQWYDTDKTAGRFKREGSYFRRWIEPDAEFSPETGRYHLYVSLACPWAHRTLIARKLKGLEHHIGVSVVQPHMGTNGWEFGDETGATRDALFGSDYLYQIYLRAKPDFSGRVTVPALWDRQTNTIVNNESSEILRMFNAAFNELEGVDAQLDLYPLELRADIDEINAMVYDKVNNGVYKAGFATRQQPYEEAARELFAALDELDLRLAKQRYLVGDRLTEADWRLFTTLVRFDPVYFTHFKCNWRRIADYPNLSGFLRELYQIPGIRETVNLNHIRRHYYGSHKSVNPHGIIPIGPQINYDAPPHRDHLNAA